MTILALDIATKCGWAYGELDSLTTGSWDFSLKRDESAGMRLVRFKAKLNELREYGIGMIVFERPAGRHVGAVIVQSELQGVLKEWAENAGIDYRGYSATEIKRYATGKGNAKKPDMIHAAIHKFGREVADDNEADALALWHLAWAEYGDGIPAEMPTPKTKKKGVRRTKQPSPA